MKLPIDVMELKKNKENQNNFYNFIYFSTFWSSNFNFENYFFIYYKTFYALDIYLFPEDGRIDDQNIEK